MTNVSQNNGENKNSYEITISNDKMSVAFRIISLDSENIIDAVTITNALAQKGIKYGIDEGLIKDICKYPVIGNEYIVAHGLQAKEPLNGKIEFLFTTNIEKKPKVLENGNVDYHDLGIIENVYKGQPLAKVIDPIEGEAGMDVCGNAIPAKPGKPAIIPKGKNVIYDSAEKTLKAYVDGQASYYDNKIQVNDCFEIKDNVDASTGDIHFVGNVVVRKNVVNGFKIECSGTVEVFGVVEGGSIKAKGDIILRKGVQGMNKSVIESGGDVLSKYIENSTVVAKGNIRCDAIMHSNIKCDGFLELEGKNGLIVGGTVKVGKEITAKAVGSPMATQTILYVGVVPEDIENLRNKKEQLKDVKDNLVKTEQIIVLLNKMKKEVPLPPEKEEMLTKSIRSKVLQSSSMNVLREEIKELENKIYAQERGKVKSLVFHPGVILEMGNAKKFIKETIQNSIFFEEGGEIRTGLL